MLQFIGLPCQPVLLFHTPSVLHLPLPLLNHHHFVLTVGLSSLVDQLHPTPQLI